MAKRRKVNEEVELNELLTFNSDDELKKIKSEINNYLPSTLKVIAKNDSQKELIKSIKNNEITICSGLAGCGKTFVALAYALNILRKETNRFKKLYLVKSVTPLKGEEIGFLKGDLNDKIEPFMMSYFLNLEKIIIKQSVTYLLEKEIIKPMPLTYLRGVTLDDCIIILDEAQNVSVDNSRTFITRIGSNSKIILLGDINQIDLKNKEESSLEKLMNLFTEIKGIGVIKMNEDDVNIRNPLIKTIEEKYIEYYENNNSNGNRNGNGKR